MAPTFSPYASALVALCVALVSWTAVEERRRPLILLASDRPKFFGGKRRGEPGPPEGGRSPDLLDEVAGGRYGGGQTIVPSLGAPAEQSTTKLPRLFPDHDPSARADDHGFDDDLLAPPAAAAPPPPPPPSDPDPYAGLGAGWGSAEPASRPREMGLLEAIANLRHDELDARSGARDDRTRPAAPAAPAFGFHDAAPAPFADLAPVEPWERAAAPAPHPAPAAYDDTPDWHDLVPPPPSPAAPAAHDPHAADVAAAWAPVGHVRAEEDWELVAPAPFAAPAEPAPVPFVGAAPLPPPPADLDADSWHSWQWQADAAPAAEPAAPAAPFAPFAFDDGALPTPPPGFGAGPFAMPAPAPAAPEGFVDPFEDAFVDPFAEAPAPPPAAPPAPAAAPAPFAFDLPPAPEPHHAAPVAPEEPVSFAWAMPASAPTAPPTAAPAPDAAPAPRFAFGSLDDFAPVEPAAPAPVEAPAAAGGSWSDIFDIFGSDDDPTDGLVLEAEEPFRDAVVAADDIDDIDDIDEADEARAFAERGSPGLTGDEAVAGEPWDPAARPGADDHEVRWASTLLDRLRAAVAIPAEPAEAIEEFRVRFARGLRLRLTEDQVVQYLAQGVHVLAPEAEAQVLLASDDASLDHRASAGGGARPGCDVDDADLCPAIVQGETLHFDDSTALDACPHLTDRPTGACAATCVPLQPHGNVRGVVHVTTLCNAAMPGETVDAVERAAQQVSVRLVELRATRRAREERARDARAHQTADLG